MPKHKTRKSDLKSTSLAGFEKLQERQLMAADISFSSGVVHIDGTESSDTVEVFF